MLLTCFLPIIIYKRKIADCYSAKGRKQCCTGSYQASHKPFGQHETVSLALSDAPRATSIDCVFAGFPGL
jgi:hypothetical protein